MAARSASGMPHFRDAILRAQLRPVLALAACAAVAVALAVLLQYLMVQGNQRNAIDELRPDEMRAVLIVAQPAQWPQLARWLVEFGLQQSLERPDQVRLFDGQLVPVHRLVQLLQGGQRLDPVSFRPLGPAPAAWLQPLGSATWMQVAAQSEGAPGHWRGMVIALSGEQRLLLQAPDFELATTHIAQTVALVSGAVFMLAASFVAVFLWGFRRWFAVRSAEQFALPVERLADALRRFAADQRHPVEVPVVPPLELAELAQSANLLQRQLSSSLRELAQAHEDQSSFVAEISHELRTPLTVIRGHAERLSREPASAESAELIMRQVEDLHRLLSDLIDLSRMTSISAKVTVEPVPVAPLLQEMHARFKAPAWRQGVVLRLETPLPDASVMADARWLRQVLANLLANAIRHTPEGGWVSLSAALIGRQLEFRVDDTGPGMEMDRAQPTIDYVGRNAGIGLRVVRSLLAAMGGTLRVELNEDGGTGMLLQFNVVA
jgi:signal transduction histidine kinase